MAGSFFDGLKPDKLLNLDVGNKTRQFSACFANAEPSIDSPGIAQNKVFKVFSYPIF